jgi:class 3 adenylate cyclase
MNSPCIVEAAQVDWRARMSSVPSKASIPPQHYPRISALRDRLDASIEASLVEHDDVSTAVPKLLELLREDLGAHGAFVRTYSEDQTLVTHAVPDGFAPSSAALETTSEAARNRHLEVTSDGLELALPLDVAGTWFGASGLLLPRGVDTEYAEVALDTACELLDNYLFALYAARRKQETMLRIAHALRHRVLSEGMTRAVRILREVVPLRDVAIVYVAEENAKTNTHILLFPHPASGRDERVTIAMTKDLKALAAAYIAGESEDLLSSLDMRGAQEEVLINGITRSVVVGKMVVTSPGKSFNTFARDLLSSFAGFVRQRIVDFNKEWRTLAACFRPDDVARLLASDGYRDAYLSPREEEIAMLYVDIAGFTRLSESVLRTPENVAKLVSVWGKDVVDIVWQFGGVFDKMVGDCVIALFGPPFYESSPKDRLEAAIRAAFEIRALTQRFGERPGFEMLRETGLAVSTGVNLAPLFVGMFGPNDNFTGFSSGMNNTARLQGCAKADEILVMEAAVASLGEDSTFVFGDKRAAAVKNVGAPIEFRPLLAIK